MLDYEILRAIWWFLLVVLLIGYAIMDGFDLGVQANAVLVAKTDSERRVCWASIAPHWDGNQVWLLLGGGAIFAAFPTVYAASFSGFYIAMILVLAALYLRPVSLEYRSKMNSPKWKSTLDWALFFSAVIPGIVIGAAFGNLLQGVPFHFSADMQVYYGIPGDAWYWHFLKLLNPFAILAGLISLSMISMQGLSWLQLKTVDGLYDRTIKASKFWAILTLVLWIVASIWIFFIDGYQVTSQAVLAGESNPTFKTVAKVAGAWLTNFNNYPVLYILPILPVVAILGYLWSTSNHKNGLSFVFSSLNIVGVIATAVSSMFPFIMPSSLNPSHSLIVWDSSSTQYTLMIMLYVAVIFVPLILAYTSWSVYKMWGRIKIEDIESNSVSHY